MTMEGNQNSVKVKDEEKRKKAYKNFCEHLAKGKSIKSWVYEDENGKCLCYWRTMLSYIEKYPELDPVHKDIAEAKGYGAWEKIVSDSASGNNKKANCASLQMVMRNKFGWDKPEKDRHASPNDSQLDQINSLIAENALLQKELDAIKSKAD